jgi:hypothetical protein
MFTAIDAIPWKDQETNTSGAIRAMHEEIFIPLRGDRRGVPNIGIVLTDGESNRDQHLTIPEANKAKTKGERNSQITLFLNCVILYRKASSCLQLVLGRV